MSQKLNRFNPFHKHNWVVIEYGDIERGGHTLTAGTRIGQWQTNRCTECGAEKETRRYF